MNKQESKEFYRGFFGFIAFIPGILLIIWGLASLPVPVSTGIVFIAVMLFFAWLIGNLSVEEYRHKEYMKRQLTK